MMTTNLKGFDRLKSYLGDVSQSEDWPFKISTWLAQINTSFETLTTKLDKGAPEPEEPDEGKKMKVGAEEPTTI